jgi:Mor family transcriptional regulator
MSYHFKFLSGDKAEQLRQIDAAIKQLKQQRFALIQPSRQMVCDRNRSLVRRLDAGEPVASLSAEFQLTRARIYEIAAKARIKARRDGASIGMPYSDDAGRALCLVVEMLLS